MVRVRLKGVAKVKSKGRTYWYAWRGGPALRGEPGSPEFVASYNEAVAERKRPRDDGRFSAVITSYKGSKQYKTLAASTRKQWAPWLDRIDAEFGTLSVAQFGRLERIRPVIIRWRNRWEDTPRTADYGMQVLSRVLAYAVSPLAAIASNPCEGIDHLWSADRSEVVWSDDDIARLKAKAAVELGYAADLAACTGLRLGDLIRLRWRDIGDDAITLATGKSRGRIEVVIPLYDELRAVLAEIPRRSAVVLTSARRTPWTANGIKTAMARAKTDAGIDGLRFHDLRGTAATRFYTAGIEERVIAEIMGWSEEHVAKIIRRYVGRSAATQAVVERMRAQRELQNRLQNRDPGIELERPET